MTKAVKGMLLSGLVLPGLGQIVLKHYGRGIALILGITAGLSVMIYEGEKAAVRMLSQIQVRGGLIDMQTITDAAARAVKQSPEIAMIRGAIYFIVACWIIGIIDAYFIGRKSDRKSKGPENSDLPLDHS